MKSQDEDKDEDTYEEKDEDRDVCMFAEFVLPLSTLRVMIPARHSPVWHWILWRPRSCVDAEPFEALSTWKRARIRDSRRNMTSNVHAGARCMAVPSVCYEAKSTNIHDFQLQSFASWWDDSRRSCQRRSLHRVQRSSGRGCQQEQPVNTDRNHRLSRRNSCSRFTFLKHAETA